MSKANVTGQRVTEHQLALLDPGLLGGRAQASSRWRLAVEVCRDSLALVTLTVLCLWAIPSLQEVRRDLAEERKRTFDSAVEVQTREREMEGSRRQVITLQAATIAQGEKLRQLNEENARLAAEVNRALRGDR